MEINNLLKSNKLSINKFKENLPPFLSIILGVLVSIPCGFILANTPRLCNYLIDLMYSRVIPYTTNIDYYMILLYTFCILFFGLISGIAISYGIKRHKYKNKKNLFILIVFCSFLIYFVFSMIFMYIFFITGYIEYPCLTHEVQHNKNYNINLKDFLMETLFFWPLFAYWGSIMERIILRITGLFKCAPADWQEFAFCVTPVVVNTVFLFIQFFITIFCTWKYILYTCPWLSEVSSSEKDKNCSTIKEEL